MRLHPRLLRALVVRGSLAWLAARVGTAIILGIAASARATAVPSGSIHGGETIVFALALAAAFVYLDLQRRHELMLWRNLGFAPAAVVCAALVPAAVLEVGWLLA